MSRHRRHSPACPRSALRVAIAAPLVPRLHFGGQARCRGSRGNACSDAGQGSPVPHAGHVHTTDMRSPAACCAEGMLGNSPVTRPAGNGCPHVPAAATLGILGTIALALPPARNQLQVRRPPTAAWSNALGHCARLKPSVYGQRRRHICLRLLSSALGRRKTCRRPARRRDLPTAESRCGSTGAGSLNATAPSAPSTTAGFHLRPYPQQWAPAKTTWLVNHHWRRSRLDPARGSIFPAYRIATRAAFADTPLLAGFAKVSTDIRLAGLPEASLVRQNQVLQGIERYCA